MIPITNQKVADLAGVRFNSVEVQMGPIVYSRTHEVRNQFPKIKNFGPCILLTSFSDASVVAPMLQRLPPNVIRWYSNNVEVRHEKVRSIPIGWRFSPSVETEFLPRYIEGHRSDQNLCYMNFMRNIPRNPNPREGLYEQFGGKKWVTTKAGFDHIPIGEFYDDLQTHAFAISPPGAGLDCHRHWEAMALGCIPIVLRSMVTEILLSDMPALIVNNWSEITPMRLQTEYPELKSRFYKDCMKKLDWTYWQSMILGDLA